MSERRLSIIESLRNECSEDLFAVEDHDQIIDVSAFDFSDTDRWLYEPVPCPPESAVPDLYAWLRSPGGTDSQSGRRSIDTRTFTRPKKRTNKGIYEPIMETLSRYLPSKFIDKGFHNTHESTSRSSTLIYEKRESIPPMLRTITGNTNLLSEDSSIKSGQESMEAFLNISQSKGIDSFINLVEPEIGDTLMNVSQPSILYSSIMSVAKDDASLNPDLEYSIKDKYKLEQSSSPKCNSLDETFSKEFHETTVLENKRDHNVSMNETFINVKDEKVSLDETYDAKISNDQITTLANIEDELALTKILSSTFTNIDDKNADPSTVLQDDESKKFLSTTYQCIDPEIKMNDTISLTTFNSCKEKTDSNVNCTVSHNEVDCASTGLPSFQDNHDHGTFIYENALNSTFRAANQNANLYQSPSLGLKQAPSLRRELLAEVQRSSGHRLNSTTTIIANEFSNVQTKQPENVNAALVRDNEIRRTELSDCNAVDMQQRKFYTFTKKTGSMMNKGNTENTEPHKNMEETFCKPAPKLQQKKLPAPKTFSKLPQFLQKSNPNLVSNSKRIDAPRYSNIPTVRQVKDVNVVRSIARPTTNKLCSLGKLKSGSEQRLQHVDMNTPAFESVGTGGSTESINSTQSAHSAPDLDDRLSACSDISHNSYGVCNTNIGQLHRIVQMQEESLKNESTPKPNKHILRNTWIEERKELPSPILKNGSDKLESNNSPPISIDSTVKTSTPTLSPTASSQTINSEGNHEENKQENHVAIIEKVSDKQPNKIENKTKLKQPTNWNTGNKTHALASGIPRPQSRIPAPRFVRSNAKTTASDLKKGYP